MLAYELLTRLNNLVLAGQNEDGELEWVGTVEQWAKVREDEYRDHSTDIRKTNLENWK